MEYNENRCRLCLEIDCDPQKEVIPVNVINALKDIFKIRLLDSSNEGLPRHLCSLCSTIVDQFYSFYVEKMANQAKLLLGLEKFNVPRIFDQNDANSTNAIDEGQIEPTIVKEDERCNSNLGQTETYREERCTNNSALEIDPKVYDKDDADNNQRDSYDTFITFSSQDTYLSDDFANDPTYTPASESLLNSQSSTISLLSRSKSASNEEITQSGRESQESRDSDVEITGVISALNSAMKRKLSQPSILNFFAVKKEKIEVRKNKITDYFDKRYQNIDLEALD